MGAGREASSGGFAEAAFSGGEKGVGGCGLIGNPHLKIEMWGTRHPASLLGQARGIAFHYNVRFEWDERKNWLNQRKHNGISFETASTIFADERCFIYLEREDETAELRWHAIGAAQVGTGISGILLVVHVYREDIDGDEVIRIISAREAGTNDIRRYQEQRVD